MDSTFCSDCVSQSTDDSAGNTTTINLCGSIFYGGSKRCPTCRSRIRTLWGVAFGFPLFPYDSYRVIDIETRLWGLAGGKYYSRRVPLNLAQVFRTWLVAAVIATALAAGFLLRRDTQGAQGFVGFCLLGPSFLFAGIFASVVFRLAGTRLAGTILGLSVYGLSAIGIFAALIYAVWWEIDFGKQSVLVQGAAAMAAPLVLLVLPGMIYVRFFHSPRN